MKTGEPGVMHGVRECARSGLGVGEERGDRGRGREIAPWGGTAFLEAGPDGDL